MQLQLRKLATRRPSVTTVAMAVANSLLTLCIALAAVGSPSAHAVPMIYPQQWVLIQQTSTIDEITIALSVSNKLMIYIILFFYCNDKKLLTLLNYFIAGGPETGSN